MTGVRSSFVTAMEDSFGSGKGTAAWVRPPPGSYLSHTPARAVKRVNTAGCKTFDTIAFGSFSGTWEWTFNLDYEYLEPLRYIFESVTTAEVKQDGKTLYRHTFTKTNNGRVPSFTIRRKQLNVMAGGPAESDECVDLVGCVARVLRLNMAAGSSQVQVAMSGLYADEILSTGTLAGTDFMAYDGQLVEFTCMFIGDKTDEETYVANTEALNVSIDNSAAAMGTVCSPFTVNYAEGLTSYAFGTTAYSNDPARYRKRVYSGGFDNTPNRPMSKGLAPIPKIQLVSYNGTLHGNEDTQNLGEVISKSDRSVNITIDDCVIRTLTWQKGDGSRLQDQISSSECRGISISVLNDIADIATAKTIENSPDPATKGQDGTKEN